MCYLWLHWDDISVCLNSYSADFLVLVHVRNKDGYIPEYWCGSLKYGMLYAVLLVRIEKCGCGSRKKSQCGCGLGFMPLLNYGKPSNSIRNLKRDSPARFYFQYVIYIWIGLGLIFRNSEKFFNQKRFLFRPRPIHICQKPELNSRWTVPLKKTNKMLTNFNFFSQYWWSY